MANALNVSRETNDLPAIVILINKSDREQAISTDEAAELYRECFRVVFTGADSLEISVSGVAKSITRMQGRGEVIRHGADNGGYWEVLR
jgi:hypothetical protein